MKLPISIRNADDDMLGVDIIVPKYSAWPIGQIVGVNKETGICIADIWDEEAYDRIVKDMKTLSSMEIIKEEENGRF